MLLKQHPEAAKCPTKDGLLPLHLAIGMSGQPSLELIQRLVDAQPGAILQLAVEYVTGEDDADPFSYDGHWVKRSWTPLARAVERKQDDVVKLMQAALHKHGFSVDDVLEPLENSFSPERVSIDMLNNHSRAKSVRSWRSLRDMKGEDTQTGEECRSQRGSDSGGSTVEETPPVVRRLKSQRSLVPLPREQSPYRHPPRLSTMETKAAEVTEEEVTDMEMSPDRSISISGSPTRYSQLNKGLSIHPASPTEEEGVFEMPNDIVQLSTIRKSPLYQGILKKSGLSESTGSFRNKKRSPRASPRAVKTPIGDHESNLLVSASELSTMPTTASKTVLAEVPTKDSSAFKKIGVAWGSDMHLDTTKNASVDSARSNVSVSAIYRDNNETNLLRKSSDQHQQVRGTEIVGFGYNDKANDAPAKELDDESFDAMKNMPTVTIKSPRGSRPNSKRIALNDGELI